MPTECKDRTPNPILVELLERCLEEAKAGELRSAVICCSYDDDRVQRYWSLDARTGLYRLLGQMAVCQAEMQAHVASSDYQSPFAELRR